MGKSVLFERSFIENSIRSREMQSYDFEIAHGFIETIQGIRAEWFMEDVHSFRHDSDLLFVGKEISTNVLVIDGEQCSLLSKVEGPDLLYALNKLFRFSIRYWNQMPFSSSEMIAEGNLAIVFPFSYSVAKDYRLVISRDPQVPRLEKREIKSSLLVFKYHNEPQRSGESANITNYQEITEFYLRNRGSFLQSISLPHTHIRESETREPILDINSSGRQFDPDRHFQFLPFSEKEKLLTSIQSQIVHHDEEKKPIRIEGGAGTGKTLSMIMRSQFLLERANNENRKFRILFLTHSKTTAFSVNDILSRNIKPDWLFGENQRIKVTTLQDFCREFIGLPETEIIDADASDAKYLQLITIIDEYTKIKEKYYKTFYPLLSEQMRIFLDKESLEKIGLLLQHEISVQIKGFCEEKWERYTKLPSLASGLPVSTDSKKRDKEFIFKVFTSYQNSLKQLNLFDTDDVVLDAVNRFRGPLWKRDRVKKGFDYIFIDETHLFNENEKLAFHFLSNDPTDQTVPICFAVDYCQAIGDQGDPTQGNWEKEINGSEASHFRLGTVFRSTQNITDFCFSIIASGATLFNPSILPPNLHIAFSGSSFPENDGKPKFYLFGTDEEMITSLTKLVSQIREELGSIKPSIAIISFYDSLIDKEELSSLLDCDILELFSRNSELPDSYVQNHKQTIVFSTPYNVNGLEFDAVIVLPIDKGRVPNEFSSDISENYLRYVALNYLYVACSRAKRKLYLLGNETRGISSCLANSEAFFEIEHR